MRTTSPASRAKSPTLPGTGDGSMVRPSRTTVKRLAAPPTPPATPNGGMMFLSPSTERLATSPRTRTSRRNPSPPRNSPSPHEPSRRPCDSIRNGALRLDHLGRLHGVEVALGECAHRMVAVGATGRTGAGGRVLVEQEDAVAVT